MYGGSLFARVLVFTFVVILLAALYNGKTKVIIALAVLLGLIVITMIIYPDLLSWLKFKRVT